MWVDDNSDEARLIRKFQDLPKNKKKTLLESLSSFIAWVKDVLWDIWDSICGSIEYFWTSLQEVFLP